MVASRSRALRDSFPQTRSTCDEMRGPLPGAGRSTAAETLSKIHRIMQEADELKRLDDIHKYRVTPHCARIPRSSTSYPVVVNDLVLP